MGEQTAATDLFVIAFRALTPAEREDVFQKLAIIRLEDQGNTEGESARHLKSLRLAAEHIGGIEKLNVTSYRKAWRELRKRGEPVENVTAIIRFFGSWREAREFLTLSESSTARQIEARFAKRRLGKIWRYTEKTLGETLATCVKEIGVPQVAQFDHWRQRQLELAKARGDDAFHLPSAGPYRRRYGSWEKALLHFGHTPDEVAERLERGTGEKDARVRP